MSFLTANHINNDQNDNPDVAEHESRKLATTILGAFGKRFQWSSSNWCFAIHFDYRFIIFSSIVSMLMRFSCGCSIYRLLISMNSPIQSKWNAKCTLLTNLIQQYASINLFVDDHNLWSILCIFSFHSDCHLKPFVLRIFFSRYFGFALFFFLVWTEPYLL